MKTIESLPQTPEQSGVSLQDFGKGKQGHLIGILGMEKVLTATFADIQEKNPNAYTVKVYRLFAEKLPFFVSNESQSTALQALKNDDPDTSKAAATVLILLNMKSISSAAKLFSAGDPDQDNDLIQAGITHLLTNISGITLINPCEISNRVHGIVVNGVVREVASKENLPAGWIRKNLHTETTKLIEESFVNHPFGLTMEQMREIAMNVSEKTGMPAESILPVIEYKNSLIEGDRIKNEEDLVHTASQSALQSTVDIAVGTLTDREQIVINARYAWGYTLEETGKLIGLNGKSGMTVAGNFEARALRRLRHPSRSKKLKPYLFPERYDVIQRQE